MKCVGGDIMESIFSLMFIFVKVYHLEVDIPPTEKSLFFCNKSLLNDEF
jgi:hypothetical protein